MIYRHGDDYSLAETLSRALDDRPLRVQLAAGALATVTERFTVPRMVDGMERATASSPVGSLRLIQPRRPEPSDVAVLIAASRRSGDAIVSTLDAPL